MKINKVSNYSVKIVLFALLCAQFQLSSLDYSKVFAGTATDFDSLDISAVVPPANPNNPSSGSGFTESSTTVTLAGLAAPKSRVVILKDGQVFNTFYADSAGVFTLTLNGLSFGSYNFGLYYEDIEGVFSNILPVQVRAFSVTPQVIRNLVLPPTTKVSPVKSWPGQTQTVSGYTAPNATVYIIDSQNSARIISVVANNNGKFIATFEVGNILGQYFVKAKAKINETQESIYGRNSYYEILRDEQTVQQLPNNPEIQTQNFPACADPNRSGRVNLTDFSIMLYWYGKSNPPSTIDCNGDRIINLVDFSILMYFWTG